MAIFDRLLARSTELARARVARVSDQLVHVELPNGIFAERIDGGVALSAKRLRRRIIDDVRLRSFADLVKGIGR